MTHAAWSPLSSTHLALGPDQTVAIIGIVGTQRGWWSARQGLADQMGTLADDLAAGGQPAAAAAVQKLSDDAAAAGVLVGKGIVKPTTTDSVVAYLDGTTKIATTLARDVVPAVGYLGRC